MENLSVSMANFIKMSNALTQREDYEGAKEQLLRACQCALLLAKQSSGLAKEKHIATFNTLKATVATLDAKIKDAANRRAAEQSSRSRNSDSATVSNANQNTYKPQDAVKPSAPEPSAPASAPQNNGAPHQNNNADVGQFTGSLSPRKLEDYIGQPKAVTAVKDLIDAALLRGAALPHIILYGSHGLGKTTFSKIISYEMQANFIEVNVTNMTPAGMIAILKELKPRDILFIDEIHTLPLQVAESIMYSAMQDGRITYTEGKGSASHTVTLDLPPFTLIGATTEIGKLAKPFTQRAIQVRLEEYTDEVLANIISASFYKLGMSVSPEMALKISKRCRNNPRIANNTVKRISDKALVRFAAANQIKDRGIFGSVDAVRKLGISITDQVVDEFFTENGIDQYGLENADRDLLRIIINRYGGGPVGIDTLARAINESNNVISQKYEAYLIKKGMLKIEPSGRVVMAQGYRVLGLPVPPHLAALEKEGSTEEKKEEKKEEPKQDNEKRTSCTEKRSVSASLTPDEIKCETLERLIVYPENTRVIEASLDELFPDVEKPAEFESRRACELTVDFGDRKRILICDSFLESRFATALAGIGYLKDIKAQTLEIPYISQQLSNRRYFPDFAIKDHKGRVAVIEMKNFDAACFYLNIDKYEKLAEYCRRNGYGYAEVMREYNSDEYISLDQIAKRPVNAELEQFIISAIEENGKSGEAVFTTKDWNAYNEQHGKVSKMEIYTVLLNNRRLRNIDNTGTDLRITLV